MNIAILGTRGIPNNYGGFEQLAEYLSAYLVSAGHQVWVFNSSLHPYKENMWQGVHIVHCKDPENKIGTAGQFIYDLNCILSLRKLKPDVVLQLGYTSSSVWNWLIPERSVLATNMDGMEWKRSKYSSIVKSFLRFAEKLAVRSGDCLIADSPVIQEYLLNKYQKHAAFIAYGATAFETPDISCLKKLELEAMQYYLLIARFEPENNIETIIQGVIRSVSSKKLVLIGNHQNKYGTQLKEKYASSDRLIFVNALYDLNLLNNLRYFCYFYFHGHSVGGTNPSLLEAMASQALICAHGNAFNKAVTGENAFYFKTADDLSRILNTPLNPVLVEKMKQENLTLIKTKYSWPLINKQYETLLTKVFESCRKH